MSTLRLTPWGSVPLPLLSESNSSPQGVSVHRSCAGQSHKLRQELTRPLEMDMPQKWAVVRYQRQA